MVLASLSRLVKDRLPGMEGPLLILSEPYSLP
jgi:hypothetical protein